MKLRTTETRPRLTPCHAIEPLEARIAPALLVDAPGNLNISEVSPGNDALDVSVVGGNFHFFNPGGLVAGANATQLDPNDVEVATAGFTGALQIDTGTGTDGVGIEPGLPSLAALSIVTGAIGPLSSINVGPGNVVLTVTNVPLSIASTIAVTGGGSIMIDALGLDLAPGSILSTDSGGSVVISTNSIPIEPTAKIQTDPNGFVSISVKSPGMIFDLGGTESATVMALDSTEIGAITAGGIRITNETGPVNITAPITFPPSFLLDITAGQGDISFEGPGSIDTAGGTVSLTAPNGGIFGGNAPVDAITGSLIVKVGQGGIGVKTNPFFFDATLLDDTSIGDAVKQFLNAVNPVGLSKLNASGAFVTLSGATFSALASDIMGEVALKVQSTLDLNGHDEVVSGLTGTGTVTNSSATAADFDVSSDVPLSSYSGFLTGNMTLTKDGPGKQILIGANPFTGDVTINSGILQIDLDAELGDPANHLIINGGTLKTFGTFDIARNITANNAAGTPTIDVNGGDITLTGTVTGNLHKTGAGNLFFGSGFTGQAPVAANSAPITVGQTTVSLGGSGDVILTVVPDPINGGTRISAVELQNTHANSNLTIKSPTGAPTTIDKIMSLNPADAVGTIKLGPTVSLGDGVNDTVPDVDFEGKVKSLVLNNINAYTRFNLGKGLAYLDTYNNHPSLTLGNVMGPGVLIDATGDGVTPAGIGGGGLGKVTINSWSDPGTIQTTQSIKSFKVKNGDCNVTLLLDPNHLGAATTANIGTMSIPNGAWGSSGTVIEGSIGSFSATEFLASANITAASLKKLTVKNGAYAGTTTLTDPTGKKLGTFSVNGDYLGFVNAAEGISNINIKGDFKGSLSAEFIGSISAYSFDGTGTNPGDRDQIVATGGSLGTLKTSVRGIKNFIIDANTIFDGFTIQWPGAPSGAVGIDNVTVAAGQINHIDVTLKPSPAGSAVTAIKDSVFESASSIGEVTASATVTNSMFAATTSLGPVTVKGALTGSKLLAGTSLGGDGILGGGNDQFTPGGSIASVTVTGMFATTTIAAGIDPGVDLIYGNGDTVGTSNLVAGPSKIGALIFGATSGTMQTSSGATHTDAIEAAAIKSLQIGTAKAIKAFATAQYLDATANGEDMADVLITII